jgi:hypothetical protein
MKQLKTPSAIPAEGVSRKEEKGKRVNETIDV